VLTTCSKDRGPAAEGWDVLYPQNGTSVTAAPTIIQNILCIQIYCTLDYSESALLAALLARLVVILRHRSNLDPHAVASLVSRPMSHTPAVRSS
jgi:hypothetical protein